MRLFMRFSALFCIACASLFEANAQGYMQGLDMAPEPDIAALLKRPEKISYQYAKLSPGESSVLISCDVQSACRSDARTLFGVLADFKESKRLNPAVFEIEYDLTKWPPEFRMKQVLGFSILGIKVKYRVTIECLYRQEAPDEYRGYWRLVDNPDGTFGSIDGTFLVKEMIRDGQPVAYMRWRQEITMRKPFPGMKPFLDIFTPKEAIALLGRYAREAEKRDKDNRGPSRP
jgi:hypothetical protein